MKDAGEPSNHQMSVGSSFTSGEGSPTQWAYDAADEDAELNINRVFWKASQPTDPVLNKLMTDAYIPRKPSRITPDKSWSATPNSNIPDASSSTTSPAERAARLRRQQKRRSPSAAQVPQAAVRTESNFDKNIHKVVAILPLVSKKADENAKREQEALREKQRKQKRGARTLVEGSAVTKKHRSSADIKGKQRAADVAHVEEEMSVSKGAVNKDESARRSETVQRDGLHPVLPPPFVPLRKAWFNDAKLTSTSTDGHKSSGLNSLKAETGAGTPSFSSSSFVAASTPVPRSDCRSHTAAVGSYDKDSAMISVSATGSASTASAPTESQRALHALCPTIAKDPPAAPHSNPAPSIPDECSAVPQLTPPQVPSLPKSNGPPVLGMRRLLSSQAPSSSQGLGIGRPLPVKQDKFKVPFARSRPEHMHGPAVVAQQAQFTPVSQSIAPGSALEKSIYTASASPSSAPALDNRGQASGAMARAQPSQTRYNKAPLASSSSTTHHAMDARAATVSDNRSSPPPAEADSSIDFDIGIDLDELERACSVYD